MNFSFKPLVLATAITLSVASVAVAGGIASMSVTDTSVSWAPEIEYASMSLSVSGPGGDSSNTFAAGADIFVDTSGMADGTYNYELVATPTSAGGNGGSQSGAFSIADGAVVDPSIPETGAAKDQVILDDLIVDGSLCVGFDCVNGESFGFDTLRLKENNVRMHFDDTSTSASFPSNDWRIVANDSSNGGANYLAIEDSNTGRQPFRVEAGARASALYVEADGDVGMGTSNPVVNAHIVDGNTPTLRLEQDGSSGFTPQTWDLAGNEANFFIRDVTNGSTLPFRIEPGAPSNAIYIDASTGDVGLGTTSPSAPLDILGPDNGGVELNIQDGNDGTSGRVQFALTMSTAANDNWQIIADPNGDQNEGLSFTRAGTGEREFRLTPNGDLIIFGELTTGGTTCGGGGCDAVFKPGYEISSIEEHAAFMWGNHHLPAVGPTAENEPFNITEKTGGMLNELEKAHIYIEQLHNRLSAKEQALHDLQDRLAKIEQRLLDK